MAACPPNRRGPTKGVGDHERHETHEIIMATDILYRDESYQIMGACFEVYKEKGCGFVEPVYQDCLEIEFELRAFPARAQVALRLNYKGRPLKHIYVPDFICYEKIILEIKAVSAV